MNKHCRCLLAGRSRHLALMALIGVMLLGGHASAQVISPPTIVKSFSAATVALNESATLTFTIGNPNGATDLTGVSFNDTLPAGLIIANPDSLTGTCDPGVLTPAVTTFSLVGGTIVAGSSCTFAIDVLAIATGNQVNTTDPVTSNEGGTGNTATATITVLAPPVIAKAFNPSSIPLLGTTVLTFTLTNPGTNGVDLTGVAFTDTLPAGLQVATPSGLVNNCGGAAAAAADAISLSGGTIGVSSSCTLLANVTGTVAGQYTNSSEVVSSDNGGNGNFATASLTVAAPPAITKAFGAVTIALNGSTSLTFTIHNPNAVALTGIAFTDNLPAGLVVASPNGLSNTCGGTTTATAGANSVSISSATLAANASCTLAVNVTGTVAGAKNNSVQVSSANGGPGNTSNAALTVVGPPTLTKAFGAASVPLNGSTSLTFTLHNPDTTIALSGVAFTDNLPAGLVVATPNGLSNTCGATATAIAGTSTLSLSGATLAANASCTLSVNVVATAAGIKTNVTGNVASANGGTGSTASASITVVAPPAISKSFNPASIPALGTASLTFTVTNPAVNTVALTGVGFTDTFPAGLLVGTPNGLSNTCGGTATAVANSNSVSLSGATVATGTSCSIVVTVAVTVSAGNLVNTTSAVSSTNGGTGASASATLVVLTPIPTPTLSTWALLLLAGLLLSAGAAARRRRR